MKVVHIGFPKTATSFLQKTIFPQLSRDFKYFNNEASSALFPPLTNYDDTIFDSKGLRQQFVRACKGHRKALFSYELLTGLHHQTGFVNRTLIAKRLRELGFERVIITIRNQFDALESTYKQYVESGGVLEFDDYISFDLNKPRYLYPEYFDYYSIYRLYAEKFGQPNVLVLQYENLQNASFLDDIFSFLDIKPFDVNFGDAINPSLSYQKTRILRLINHMTYNSFRPSHLISKRISTAFFYRRLSRIPFLNGRKTFLNPHKRKLIASFYRESNEKLQKNAGITLSSDYP